MAGYQEMYDVVICGGTLGIFIACAMQMKGFRTIILEKGVVKGRSQDWNISRAELLEFVDVGILDEGEIDEIIGIEFNPMRGRFHGYEDQEISVDNILNCGVLVEILIQKLKDRFQEHGGVILELCTVQSVRIFENCVSLDYKMDDEENSLQGRLLIDSMGNFSPILQQMRRGQKPDGVCISVGSCARCERFRELNASGGDLIATCTDITRLGDSRQQYFWEAFPASNGPEYRTTYMFTYMDADESRPTVLDILSDYWRLLPKYQSIQLDDLEIERIVYGIFPTFKAAPVKPEYDRIIQVGDAGGLQSPLSFGGVAALTRHISRLTTSIEDALRSDLLTKNDLRLIQSYQPGLSSTWLFQKAMSVGIGKEVDNCFVNKLLGTNFAVMGNLGPEYLRPFLQDVVQAKPLFRTLLGMVMADISFIPSIIRHLGPASIASWLTHFLSLFAFDIAYKTFSTFSNGGSENEGLPLDVQKPIPRFEFFRRRAYETLRYGSGLDYGRKIPPIQ